MKKSEFMTTKTWQRVNSADGDYRYEKVWLGSQLIDNAMITFKGDDGDILLEVVLWEEKKRKVFIKGIVHELIEMI